MSPMTPNKSDSGELDSKLGKIIDVAVYAASTGTDFNKVKILAVRDIKRALTAHIQAVGEEIIGADVQPKMNDKSIPKGQTVTIDLENNFRESCAFIEDNAKFILQQEQRKRLAQYLGEKD